MVIQLGDTKTSSRRLVDAHVVVRRPPTPLMAETVLALASKLRPHPAREFKASFLQLCNFFQLPVSFRPYSLRRGGAAETFLWRGAMIKSMLRGPWGRTPVLPKSPSPATPDHNL